MDNEYLQAMTDGGALIVSLKQLQRRCNGGK